MNDYLSIGETAKALGVSVPTLRRWDHDGKFSPNYRTNGHHRRYSKNSVFSLLGKQRKKKMVGYARVSSHDQKDDLQRQIGQVKYRDKLNLTIHESAAYVIARRGQGFKEKKPKNVLRIRKELPKMYCRDHPSCNQIVALLDKTLQAKSMSVILSKVFKKPDWKPLLGDKLNAYHRSLPTRILDRWSVLPYNRECYLTY